MAKCPFTPETVEGPIGMFHCPECGEMVLAGYPHPDYDEVFSILQRKIKRNLSYDVYYYNEDGDLVSRYFETAKRAKSYVNYLHSLKLPIEIEMTKTWCYRNHHPRHRTYYLSPKPNTFVILERY